jgi:hypothetical protein
MPVLWCGAWVYDVWYMACVYDMCVVCVHVAFFHLSDMAHRYMSTKQFMSKSELHSIPARPKREASMKNIPA